MVGEGHLWCEGCAWQGAYGVGACVAGAGHAWWGSMHGRGACVAGEMATAADGTDPTGMHYCENIPPNIKVFFFFFFFFFCNALTRIPMNKQNTEFKERRNFTDVLLHLGMIGASERLFLRCSLSKCIGVPDFCFQSRKPKI